MFTMAPIIQASLLVLLYAAFTAWCMRKQWFKRPANMQAEIIVAYASETGNAQALAEQLVANICHSESLFCHSEPLPCHSERSEEPPAAPKRSFIPFRMTKPLSCHSERSEEPPAAPTRPFIPFRMTRPFKRTNPSRVELLILNQLKPEQLQHAKTLLVIASTCGEGDAPENGRLFEERLKQAKELDLTHLNTAVLALGNEVYAEYCAFGLRIFFALKEAQTQSLFNPVLVDNLNAEHLRTWQENLLEAGIISHAENSNKALPEKTLHKLELTHRQCLNHGSQGAPMHELIFNSKGLPQWEAGDIATLQINEQEREYTIASIPAENQVRLLIREQYLPNGENGLGTGFLCKTLNKDENAQFSIRSNPTFHAPSTSTPIILIGNGTGLAGLRAHLKQREGKNTQNWLIYGERSPVHDRPWNQELNQWLNNGHLKQLDLTFSRHDGCQYPDGTYGRCHQGYVQQVIRCQAEEIKSWLQQGATIYLCGSKQGMAEDVESALNDVLGEQQVTQLIEQERFKRDVY